MMVILANLLFLGFLLPFIMKRHDAEQGDAWPKGVATWLMYGRVTLDHIPTGWHARVLCYHFTYANRSGDAPAVLCIWDRIHEVRRFWHVKGLRLYRIRNLGGLG